MPLPGRHLGGGKCLAASRETRLRTTDDPRDAFLPKRVLLSSGHCHCKSSFIAAGQKPRSGQLDKVRKATKPQVPNISTNGRLAHIGLRTENGLHRKQISFQSILALILTPTDGNQTSQPNSLLIWLLVGPSLPRSTQLICNTFLIHKIQGC